MKRTLLLILGAISSGAFGAEWLKLSTDNFELYTTSSEREGRQTLEVFEQVRDFFMRIRGTGGTRLPVTIIGFKNPKEYKPFAVREGTTAYYTADAQRDFIVMSDLGSENTPIAIHEYMHLLVRHSGWKMPVWLSEGFAEVYSTLKPIGGSIVLGTVPAGRPYALARRGDWLPLSTLAAVRHDSPEYNEKNRVGVLYAQSWLLTHMLMLSDNYRAGFSKFVEHLTVGGSTEQAFQSVYGKALSDVEKDLRLYYGSSALKGVAYKARFEKFELRDARPANELETGLALARLLTLLGQYADAAIRLNGLAATHPEGHEVLVALAQIDLRRQDLTAARTHMAAAIGKGATHWTAYWDYARLLTEEGGDAAKLLEMLRKTIELNPTLVEAQLLYGHRLYEQRRYAQALVTLRAIKTIDPERAGGMLLVMAYSALEIGEKKEAKRNAEQALKYARDANERNGATRLLKLLEEEGTK